ncbi:ABC transporter A family member 2 [Camellia lanceoleosa]|uniref:ABC transporter A family member 2 n=1 Tax=Camellia lanceoleosa TaxID=1840588 RepID=A0ACC0FDH6_9ERIC|nr:ABC transporter A family member 2 [Camellia lanceoleosa]
MELQSGLGLLIQQYKALLKKNIILSWRNRRSTIAQLLSPFFFVFLLYAISQALANHPNSIYDPQPLLAPPIPPCEDKFFITLPCFDFAWSGNDTALIVSIVHRIMNNNPARPIPPNKVKSFRTKKEVDEWPYNNPTHCPGALHFAAMTMMGLYDTAYWLSWLTWETLFCALFIASHCSLWNDVSVSLFHVQQLCNCLSCVLSLPIQYGNSLSSSLNFLSAYSGLDTWFPISDQDSSKPQYEILIADLLSLAPDTRLVLPSCCQLSFKATFYIWFVLALYLDNRIPNSSGVRKSIIYFLNPGYWTGKGGNKVEDGSIFSFLNSVPQVERKTSQMMRMSLKRKTRSKSKRCSSNMWTCKDISWEDRDRLLLISFGILTGEEHLHLFASIKGLLDSSIKLVAEKSLAEVRLTKAAQRRAGSYSGGMKRCLSVAIAVIGDPKLVILDEPTTGMDPITRRHVWDIIENAKKGRAIILTTHSMEEADILSDRIGIVAKGTLCCIGTSIRLKSRFGSGIVANMSFTSEEEAIAKTRHEALKFFKHHLNVVPKEETNYFLSYVIANEKEHLLTNFFAELQ